MMRQGFEGPNRTVSGMGRDFVLERVVGLGLDVIVMGLVQIEKALGGAAR
jgi:hypothetical protein